MTGYRRSARHTFKLGVQIAAFATIAALAFPLTQLQPQEAMATHCYGADHCYAIEANSLTTYGNSFTTIVSDLSVSDCNTYLATVEQWIRLPNNDFLENGFTVGTFNGGCVNEISYHAWRISGAYSETNDGTATIGSTKTYEVSDVNKDKTWDFKVNGVTKGTKSISPYTNGIGQQVGAETTDHNVTIPKTHMWDIAWLKSTGVWEYWALANDFFGESPLWIINCTPAYRHVHVGSGTVGNCF